VPAAESLYITIIQPDIIWEDKANNLDYYLELIDNIKGTKEIVVLPEMFSTGFSMAPERLGERMDGETVSWMREVAAKHRIILTGSLIIEDQGQYYNRLIWMQPDGFYSFYDKRHLFGYAEEDGHYTAGSKKLITQVKGWRICPLVCYDLRFPVWARNVPGGEYDVLLYVANWPQRRSLAWRTLLQARAIENQAYCIGVNRIGEDGKGITYSGDSSVFDPLGEMLWQETDKESVYTVELSRQKLEETRNHFPFLRDADKFLISE
jgi:predicted amidohydrolase